MRLLHEASRVPLPESPALQILARDIDAEQTARTAIKIAKSYRIVAFKTGYRLTAA